MSLDAITTVGRYKPSKNKFDLSHEKKLTGKMGNIIPIMCQEVMPGDSFRVKSELLLRLPPMVFPVMHRVDIKTSYFYVPNRIIWDEWEDFITGGDQGTANPAHPFIDINDATKAYFSYGSLADYLGTHKFDGTTTVDSTSEVPFNALPFRAYQSIYNYYFRDQDLVTEINFPKTSGSQNGNVGSHCPLRKVAFRKDYFTSARPWTQKGDPAVVPITVGDTVTDTWLRNADGTTSTISANIITTGTNSPDWAQIGESGKNLVPDNLQYLITDLRRASRLQEFLERDARGGNRLVESTLNHFGERIPDFRVSEPEYLGGGSTPVSISEVIATANSEINAGATEQVTGELLGHGISMATGNGFKKSFKEHGWIIGVMWVMPKPNYAQAVQATMLNRADRFDYPFPSFANIGEQKIQYKELFWKPTSYSSSAATFGYQQRYAEYKHQHDTVHGEFADPNSAFFNWHLGRHFGTGSAPQLNQAFIEDDGTEFNRIFNVTDPTEDHLWVQCYNKVDAIRPLPYNSIPTL